MHRKGWLFLVVALASLALLVGVASAAPSATVVTVSPTPGTTNLQVGVAIPKTVVTQSFSGKKSWNIDVSVTYLSINNTIETVDSGVVPVARGILVGPIDSNTDAVQYTLSFAGHPDPGNQPSYTGTATLSR